MYDYINMAYVENMSCHGLPSYYKWDKFGSRHTQVFSLKNATLGIQFPLSPLHVSV